MDLAELLQYVKDAMRSSGKLTETAYNLWVKDMELLSFDGNCAVLSVDTTLKKNFIRTRLMDNLSAAFKEVTGVDMEIQVVAQEEDSPAASRPGENGWSSSASRSSQEMGDYEYTFETFIVGTSNKFAHAACLAVAQNPGKGYNPLFIYGGSGLGKTHLLYAIMAELRKDRPDINVVYVKGEDFTNELISAIQNKNTVAFRDKYRQADVLLVDDIQFIAGKEQTQE